MWSPFKKKEGPSPHLNHTIWISVNPLDDRHVLAGFDDRSINPYPYAIRLTGLSLDEAESRFCGRALNGMIVTESEPVLSVTPSKLDKLTTKNKEA